MNFHQSYILSVDGKWQPWSLWSGCSKTCGGGNQQRNRICYGPFFGGQPCPGEREEVRSCNEKRCPGEWLGTWFALHKNWKVHYLESLNLGHVINAWHIFMLLWEQSLMKYVERTTILTLYGRWLQLGIQQQYAALLMPWVSSHASCIYRGYTCMSCKDIAQQGFTKELGVNLHVCPHTGLILRRCTLDEEGIAYWENPTYMKCISNDYRSIQTLVSLNNSFLHQLLP